MPEAKLDAATYSHSRSMALRRTDPHGSPLTARADTLHPQPLQIEACLYQVELTRFDGLVVNAARRSAVFHAFSFSVGVR